MQFCMATHCLPFGLSPDSYKINFKSSCSSVPQAAIVMFSDRGSSYNPLVFQAVRLLGPPARFEASKLKVEFKGEEKNRYTRIVPRTYTLSHCDFTADLTLTISRLIHLDQLKGWYNKDDVVAQWTEVNGDVCLDVHCYVSGPNPLLVLVAELRYHIFSKELPLVLKAVLHGDSAFFSEHQELMNASVRVYFHSSSKKYNRIESWGPLKDAAQERPEDNKKQGLLATEEVSHHHENCRSPKSLFQALVAFLL
ncbi:magnesium dechelatase SGRL, chloroplastic-like isoform X1 [Apium graveolens]|uniref:magnesium dechelatase SGRL, chloroplastic-like isoform X1 n=1 Tax=Apium graveolens TaxID=4045 RepID=UPI003D7A25EB